MRRKGDMFKGFSDRDGASFLPGEGEQEATTAAVELRERLAKVEEQLRSQFTSIAAYAQISQHAVETARAESRADLDREKATIVSLLERLREEALGMEPSSEGDRSASESSARSSATAPSATTPSITGTAGGAGLDGATLDRLQALEDRLDRLTGQFAEVLRSQEELAKSIAFMFEQQMRGSGWIPNCADAPS